LAIAEFPSVVKYLSNAQETQLPYQERLLKQNRGHLGAIFSTLLNHFGRYTRLALIDTNGDEHFLTQSPTSAAANPVHAGALYFRDAMTLKARNLYVASPYLRPGAAGPEITTAVVDVTAPVFGQAMSSSNRGEALLGDHLIFSRTHDISTHHFRSQSGQVLGLLGTQASPTCWLKTLGAGR
jgi:hypothetical protein